MSLFKAGMRRGRIVREIRAQIGVVLYHSQVVDWTERGISPFGRVHRFKASPSPELAYLCGVKLGDATQSKGTWQHSYKFRLLVIDEEFAEEFSRCASVVLKCRQFKVWWYEKRRMWCTEVSSIMLYRFIEGGLIRFKDFISHCSECAASFLRGFFDSEGTVGSSGLSVSNGDLEVLRYVQTLLKSFYGIETTGPCPQGPPPGTKRLIKGKLVNVNLQVFNVRVRNKCLSFFANSIGFTILRKAKKLEVLANSRFASP